MKKKKRKTYAEGGIVESTLRPRSDDGHMEQRGGESDTENGIIVGWQDEDSDGPMRNDETIEIVCRLIDPPLRRVRDTVHC